MGALPPALGAAGGQVQFASPWAQATQLPPEAAFPQVVHCCSACGWSAAGADWGAGSATGSAGMEAGSAVCGSGAGAAGSDGAPPPGLLF